MQTLNLPSNVQLKFKTDCGQGESQFTNKCEKIQTGTAVRFTAVISVANCLKDPIEFDIYPKGIGQVNMYKGSAVC